MTLEFDCSFCETDHFLGAAGICDFENETCKCPEGFSGKDDWLTHPGCQINDQLRNITHVVLLVFSVITVITSALWLCYLNHKWNLRINFGAVRGARFQSTAELTNSFDAATVLFNKPTFCVFGFADLSRMKLSSSLKEMSRKNFKRKQYTLLAIIFFLISYVSVALYNALIMNSRNREDAKCLVFISYYLVVVLAMIGAQFINDVWFHTLPDVSKYGRMLNINRIVVRYPNMIPTFLQFKNVVYIIAMTLLIFVPLIWSISAEAQLLVDYSVIALATFALVLDGCFFFLTMTTVEEVFTMAIATYERNGNNLFSHQKAAAIEINMMKNSMQSIRSAKNNWIPGFVLSAGMQLINMSTGLSQVYIYNSMIPLFFCIFVISAPFSFIKLDSEMSSNSPSEDDTPNATI